MTMLGDPKAAAIGLVCELSPERIWIESKSLGEHGAGAFDVAQANTVPDEHPISQRQVGRFADCGESLRLAFRVASGNQAGPG